MKKYFKLCLFISIYYLSLTPVAGKAAIAIQPGIGGAWYNPDENGHGLILNVIEVKNELSLLATWYVYDNAGNQMWLIGSAPFEKNDTSVTVPVITTRGPQLDNLSGSDVSKTNWGTLTFEFSTCDQGSLTFNPVSAFNAGTKSIQRLTNTASVPCIPKANNNPQNPDTQPSLKDDIEIVSISLRDGTFFGGVATCVADIVVKNNSSKLRNVAIRLNGLSASQLVATTSAVGNIQGSETVTLEGPFIAQDRGDSGISIQCAKIQSPAVDVIKVK